MNLKIVRWVDLYAGVPLEYLVRAFTRPLSKSLTPHRKQYNKILIMKFWGVGNIIMLLPAVSSLRKRYPGARIDILTLTNNREVCEAACLFSRIFTINIKDLGAFIASLLKGAVRLRKENYDLIIDFEQFARFSALLSRFIGKKERIGFNTKNQHRHVLFTKSVCYDNSIHVTGSFFSLIVAVTDPASVVPEPVALAISSHCEEEVQALLQKSGISKEHLRIVLHIGTSENFNLRRWPLQHFARLADTLIGRYNARVIFTGLPAEKRLVHACIGLTQQEAKTLDLSGKLSFARFVALVKSCDLVVCADTAPVHVASSLSVPVAGLYGPNTPRLYGPWAKNGIYFYQNLPCSPCITNYNAKINRCSHPQGAGACMNKISPEEVFLAIQKTFFDENSAHCIEKIKKCANLSI